MVLAAQRICNISKVREEEKPPSQSNLACMRSLPGAAILAEGVETESN